VFIVLDMAQGDRALLHLTPANLATIAARGVPVPTYERSRLILRIAHIGVGGFHRAHLAAYTHELAEDGADWGIRGLGVLPGDAAMAAALLPQHCLYSLVEKGADEPSTQIIGSLVEYRHTAGRPDDAIDVLADPDVAIVSLTVTEAGYVPGAGPDSTFDLLARALDRRRQSGAAAVTVLSCDNLPGNGTAARVALLAAADAVGGGLASWIEAQCSFPNSMVDRITPVTSEADRAALAERDGIVDRWPVVAEPFRQWVLEDAFVAGRPRWDDVGALFTDDVHGWELYKLRILNAGHSCLAYLCALAGITFVHEALAVPEVREFLSRLLYDEAVPALKPIPGHPRAEYAATVIGRFANPGVRDQISRLCIDGTAKFPTFLIPTIEHHLAVGGPVRHAALSLAGWARYLAVVPVDEQAPDASGELARDHAHRALDEPTRFLDLDAVFPTAVRDNVRFRSEFAGAARSLAKLGPVAAMGQCVEQEL
jgi:mannitol 2-dehydrogenase